MPDRIVTLEPGSLTAMIYDVFVAAGASDDNAARVAASLVDANLAGHDSHGVIRVPEYIAAMRAGELVGTAHPAIAQENAASALVTGNWTYGQVTAAFATEVVVAKAKHTSLAVAGVTQCHHTGRLGEYATMAATNGMILLLLGGGLGDHLPLAAPFGGRRPALGANPIAAGFPVGADGSPMIIDFATTAVAAGKVQVARAAGAQLPPGSLLNRDGLPTTDPHDFYAGGMLLPFGAHKGFAVALMAEFLVAALVNPRGWEQEGRGGPVFGTSGLFMIAIDPAIFGTREDYDRIAQSIVQRIKSVPAAPGFAEVLMPGEPEMRARQQRLRGIPIEAATWHAVCTTAAELGVTPCQSLP